MKIFVCQFYIEPGIKFPFSHYFQHRISDEITQRIVPSAVFVQKYAAGFNLIFRMSAKASLTEPEIRGPTVFKKHKSVEFTLFLTFNKDEAGPSAYRRVLMQLMQQIVIVLKSLQMDVSRLIESSHEIVEGVLAAPKMIDLDEW